MKKTELGKIIERNIFCVDINEESTALYTPLARSPSFSFISFSKISIKLAWIVDNRLRPFYMNKTD